MGLNIPESTLDFTFRIHCTNSALDASIAIRHPAMLCDLLMEFNSMQHFFAPGTERMLSFLSFKIKLYGLSLQITMLCFSPKATNFSNNVLVALAPVGIFG